MSDPIQRSWIQIYWTKYTYYLLWSNTDLMQRFLRMVCQVAYLWEYLRIAEAKESLWNR